MKKLKIPVNISTRPEIWKGLSYRDGLKVLTVLLVSSIIGLSYVKLISDKQTLGVIFTVLIITAVTFVFLTRLDGLSPYELIKIQLAYSKKQNRFLYRKEIQFEKINRK